MTRILIVEDNPKFREGVSKYFLGKGVSVNFAEDYDSAIKMVPSFNLNGALIDCFFPQKTGSNKLEMGYAVIERMRKTDAYKKDSPVTRALTQVGNLFRRDFAKFAARNAHVDYSGRVDNYWALKQAIKESESNQPLGILVADEAVRSGIPFVLVTSTNHHDELTQPIQDYASRKGWRLVDCSPGRENDKATSEFWGRAYSELEGIMRGS